MGASTMAARSIGSTGPLGGCGIALIFVVFSIMSTDAFPHQDANSIVPEGEYGTMVELQTDAKNVWSDMGYPEMMGTGAGSAADDEDIPEPVAQKQYKHLEDRQQPNYWGTADGPDQDVDEKDAPNYAAMSAGSHSELVGVGTGSGSSNDGISPAVAEKQLESRKMTDDREPNYWGTAAEPDQNVDQKDDDPDAGNQDPVAAALLGTGSASGSADSVAIPPAVAQKQLSQRALSDRKGPEYWGTAEEPPEDVDEKDDDPNANLQHPSGAGIHH